MRQSQSSFNRPNPDQWKQQHFATGPDGLFALEIWSMSLQDGEDSEWVLVYGDQHTAITDGFAAQLLRDGVFTAGDVDE